MTEKEYIPREAAKQKLAPVINDPDAIDFWEWQCSEIDDIPAADVRPVVKAQWVPNVPHRDLRPRCTACGMLHPVRTYFCPNCGAMMENLSNAEHDKEQREYEAAIEAAQYCEMYETTYDPETGAM